MTYTEEETALIIKMYLALDKDNSRIEEIAEAIGKNKKSVIGKLSREGVYEKKVYKTKTGEDPVTKKELVHKIAVAVNEEPEALAGLEKSPKQELKRLLTALENLE